MEPKLLTAARFVDMRMGCMYRYVWSDTEYFRPHYHDYCEIFVILEGHALHQVNGHTLPLDPGDLVFIRPSDTHDYVPRDGCRFSMLNITFTIETLDALFAYLGDGFHPQNLMNATLPPCTRLTASEFDAFRTRTLALQAIPETDLSALKTALRVLLFDIFTRYFSEYPGDLPTIPTWLDTLCSQMRRDGNYIEGSSRMFSLTDKSREHVCRSMKKYMGMTVSEFINDLRLIHIANMLRNSNHSVTQIIFDSGFNNISWANQCFRQKYGMTMGAFRGK